MKDNYNFKLKKDLTEIDKNFEKIKFELNLIITEKDFEIFKYVNICKRLKIKYGHTKLKNNENGISCDMKNMNNKTCNEKNSSKNDG